jgi:N-methylhydantoinase A
MTRLINIDNGGTLTDFCLVDGGDVRYTKTLTTPRTRRTCSPRWSATGGR